MLPSYFLAHRRANRSDGWNEVNQMRMNVSGDGAAASCLRALVVALMASAAVGLEVSADGPDVRSRDFAGFKTPAMVAQPSLDPSERGAALADRGSPKTP